MRRKSTNLSPADGQESDASGPERDTCRADDEVVTSAVECLRAVAEAGPRRHGPFQVRPHGRWIGCTIIARVESQRYGARRADRPVLTAYFHKRGRPRQVVAVRVGVEAPGWWQGLAVTTTSIRDIEGKRRWLRGARRSRRRLDGTQHWHVTPRTTPLEVTTLALYLFLWRAGLLEPFEDGRPGRVIATGIIARHLRRRERKDTGDVVLRVLEALRLRYSFPEHWKEFRRYLARVVGTVAERPPAGEADAKKLGVGRATLYRWRASGLDVAARAQRLRERRQLRDLVKEHTGKSSEAARKFVERALARDPSVASLARSIRSQKGPRNA